MADKYLFPVKDKFQARAVTEPEFEPDLFEGINKLYVNLDDVRGKEYLEEIKYELGIENKSLQFTDDYVKIIFSGHRGCGKTTELKRLHHELNTPEQYTAIFISIEEETEYSRFEPEDFYLLLITRLIQRLEEDGIKVNQSSLKELGKKLFSSEEVKEEISKTFAAEIGTENEAGFNIFGWLKSKANFKALFSGENKSSTEIRREIKQNTLSIIEIFNTYLVDVREALSNNNKGKDLLYFFDGSEKIKPEVFSRLFVQDAGIINRISANMIMSVRIDAFYTIKEAPVDFTNYYTVPMIKMDNNQSKTLLRRIIEKRIDCDTFFDDAALNYIVGKSGGCVRQLLIITNTALRKSRGNKIMPEHAEKATHEIGKTIRESLDSQHLEILKKGIFEPADPKTGEMLFRLALLKYNGSNTIKPNPVLDGLIN